MNRTKQELVFEITILANQLRRIAGKLDSLEEVEWSEHAEEMRGAGMIADGWVEGLKSELSQNPQQS